MPCEQLHALSKPGETGSALLKLLLLRLLLPLQLPPPLPALPPPLPVLPPPLLLPRLSAVAPLLRHATCCTGIDTCGKRAAQLRLQLAVSPLIDSIERSQLVDLLPIAVKQVGSDAKRLTTGSPPGGGTLEACALRLGRDPHTPTVSRHVIRALAFLPNPAGTSVSLCTQAGCRRSPSSCGVAGGSHTPPRWLPGRRAPDVWHGSCRGGAVAV
jgi:hypothetical protein